jgi:type IV fimbrial biogenesis protein FimT
MQQKAGFTLIELMVALALATVLLTLGAPKLRDVIANNRVAARANEFLAALNLARSEAIKRGARVVVCKVGMIEGSRTPDFSRCDKNGDWSDGWILFADVENAFSAADPFFEPPDEAVIQKHAGLDGLRLSGNAPLAYRVSFLESGKSGQFGTFALAPPQNAKTRGRCIKINRVGRIEIDAEHFPDPTTNPPSCSS